MKNFIFFLGSLLVAIGAAFLLDSWLSNYNDPGYVLIGIGQWSLETSVVVFALSLVIFFLSFMCFFVYWVGC